MFPRNIITYQLTWCQNPQYYNAKLHGRENIKYHILLSFSLHLCQITRKDPAMHPKWNLFEHEKCGLNQADRIIVGKDAAPGAYTWIARIGYISM